MFDDFADPPAAYSLVPFWFLNDRLDSDRLQWQVQQMWLQHVYGAVMHARPGLATPYLSEDWFDAIASILKQAKELEMFMWIYDEYPWMSGMAEYRVPKLHEDFRIRALGHLSFNTEDMPDILKLPSGSGKVIAAAIHPVYDGILLPAIQTASGPDAYNKVSVLSQNLDNCRVFVFFERFSFNPYGDQFGTFPVTDLMNPEAIRQFIRLTHQQYSTRFPDYIGSTITATFTDEPPSCTPGWSVHLAERFRQQKGYDLLQNLAYLFEDKGRKGQQVRLDYGETLSSLYEEAFFGQLESWSDINGIASTGHLLLEETLPFHCRFMGDYFKSMRRFHAPGVDYIFPGVIPAVVCKQAASAAKLHGRQRVMSECYALTGWDFNFQRMKWMADWQFVNGVNLLVPHAFFYSITETEPIPDILDDLGFRWYDCPPSMFFQQPYWDYYSVFADYIRRCQYLLSQGHHVARVAVYYPYETAQADFVPTKEAVNVHAFQIPGTWMTADYLWDGSPAEVTDAHYRCLCNTLRDAGIDYDIIDDDSIRRATVSDGRLAVEGAAEYDVVLLPNCRFLSVDVYRRLASLVTSGGSLMATGILPENATEGPSSDFEILHLSRMLFASNTPAEDDLSRTARFEKPNEELVQHLKRLTDTDFSTDSDGIYCHHRTIEGADIYFVINHTSEEKQNVFLQLAGQGKPVILDPLTGLMHPVDYSEANFETLVRMVRLSFSPYESFFIILDPVVNHRPEGSQLITTDRMRAVKQLDGSWNLDLDRTEKHPYLVSGLPPYPDVDSLPQSQTLKTLVPWESLGLEEYSGKATYTCSFELPDFDTDKPYWLDLGEVGIAAEVLLNGIPLGVALWQPYRFRIDRVLKVGRNTLQVTVANTLMNSIAASYSNRKAETSASDQHIKDWATLDPTKTRSGLIGPVLIYSI